MVSFAILSPSFTASSTRTVARPASAIPSSIAFVISPLAEGLMAGFPRGAQRPEAFILPMPRPATSLILSLGSIPSPVSISTSSAFASITAPAVTSDS